MAFIAKADLLDYVESAQLAIISQTDDTIITRIIARAESEVSFYLAHRFDLATEFAKSGDSRHQFLLGLCIDVALYHLFTTVVPRNIPQIRFDRYDQAKIDLKEAQRGIGQLGLTVATDSDGEQTGHRVLKGNKTTAY